MQNCDLILSADIIVTQNKQRDIIQDGAIAIADSRIAAIGPAGELEKNWQATTTRNLGNALVMPGLVNAHTHIPMTLLRGLADDLPLMEWLEQHIFPREALLSPQMLEIGTLLGCAEMLRTGTTACADMYLNEPYIYRSLEKCGFKALVSEGISGFPTIGCQDPDCVFDIIRSHAEELRDKQSLRYAIAPHSVYTTNMEILEQSAALAQELGLALHVHVAESPSEIKQSLDKYGCRPVEVCRRAGLLGPKTFIAHGVELEADEIDLLAREGVSLVHCPKSNMKLASGVAKIPQLITAGVNVALGTDGAASNNTLNMFAEMNAAALLHKVHAYNPTSMPAQTVLDMATLNSGKAINWPELGSLTKGGPADLCALDLNFPNLNPLSSPVSHLIYAASGHEVCLTMIDGQILYDNGNFTSLDYPAIRQEAQNICDWLLKNN